MTSRPATTSRSATCRRGTTVRPPISTARTQYPCDTRDPSTLNYNLAAANAIVHFVIWLDVAWNGYPAEPIEDDDGIGSDVAQIFLLTNGDITATELDHDMLVGSIHSTEGDVTLYSPRRIIDSDAQDTIDVAGNNITMHSGLLDRRPGQARAASAPRPTSSRSTPGSPAAAC